LIELLPERLAQEAVRVGEQVELDAKLPNKKMFRWQAAKQNY